MADGVPYGPGVCFIIESSIMQLILGPQVFKELRLQTLQMQKAGIGNSNGLH